MAEINEHSAQYIFDAAMHLIDETRESDGETDYPDTKEYKNRSLSIINTLRGECFPYSDTFKAVEPGKRPICPRITDFESDIFLDDYIIQTVLPYGLAAGLLSDENPSLADYLQQRYYELLKAAEKGKPSQAGAIEDVYGFGEYDDDGNWHGWWPYQNFSRW